jgi:REP element-mobilizing transposase RayT
MPRQARLDAPGALHHIIIRGIEKRKIVDDQVDRKEIVLRLGNLAKETKTALYAWALMTNHAHLLIRTGPEPVSNLMRRLLTGYAVYYNRRHRRHGHLFQNRYKSILQNLGTFLTNWTSSAEIASSYKVKCANPSPEKR